MKRVLYMLVLFLIMESPLREVPTFQKQDALLNCLVKLAPTHCSTASPAHNTAVLGAGLTFFYRLLPVPRHKCCNVEIVVTMTLWNLWGTEQEGLWEFSGDEISIAYE